MPAWRAEPGGQPSQDPRYNSRTTSIASRLRIWRFQGQVQIGPFEGEPYAAASSGRRVFRAGPIISGIAICQESATVIARAPVRPPRRRLNGDGTLRCCQPYEMEGSPLAAVHLDAAAAQPGYRCKAIV